MKQWNLKKNLPVFILLAPDTTLEVYSLDMLMGWIRIESTLTHLHIHLKSDSNLIQIIKISIDPCPFNFIWFGLDPVQNLMYWQVLVPYKSFSITESP